MSKTKHYFFYGFLLLLWVVFLDQYSKWLIIEMVLKIDGDFLPFVKWFITPDRLEYFVAEREVFNSENILPFLDLVMVWNQGISFGMFDNNATMMPYVFASISLTIALFMIIWLVFSSHMTTALAIGLVAGGAIGNAIDRLRFGAVADFVDLHYNGYHWPAFNVADICITVGAFIMSYTLLFVKDNVYKTVDV